MVYLLYLIDSLRYNYDLSDLFFGRVPFVLGINVGVNSSILRRVLKLLVIVQLSLNRSKFPGSEYGIRSAVSTQLST